MERIRIGISKCLLGEKVRYDGQHKHDSYVADVLSAWFEYVPLCPEVECGMGVPREAMRLVGDVERPRMVTTNTSRDLTEQMASWCAARISRLEADNLCGFILKRKSPSCGMERVKVYPDGKGMSENKGVGLFARAFMARYPNLPVEEEGRLHDPALRENFVERVFTLKRWREMLAEECSRAGLVKFHERHKYLLMAHSIPHYRGLGQIVAAMKGRDLPQVQSEYHGLMMEALALRATVKKHANVLQHMAGYFKRQLDAAEKAELGEVIDRYREGFFPLVVPVTLINHYVRKYGEPYLARQYYLNPHPVEMRLRNHVF